MELAAFWCGVNFVCVLWNAVEWIDGERSKWRLAIGGFNALICLLNLAVWVL